ncbi:MAG: proteasome assembly chaperone family protein [Methanosarcinales archaeon]|nr:proteasome assembly chaperone family protein [Methanosarcinales archaeon]
MFQNRFICICGLPGIGSVGKVAADFLATSLQCSTINPFFSSSFPPQVMVSEGLAELMHCELMRPREKENILILSGDAQPLDVVGMHELAGEILQVIKEQGVTDVITLAAYVGEAEENVLGAATDPELAAALAENDIPLLKDGAIGGMNGLLAGLAPMYGLRGFCLLATTSGSEALDLAATANLLAAIKELLGLDLDLSLLEPTAPEQEEQSASDIDMNYI